MARRRPTGVNIIIAVSIAGLILSGALNLHFAVVRQLQMLAFINAPFMLVGAAGITGLWLMRRWGFWITIATNIIGLVTGSLNTTMLVGLVPHFPIGKIADVLILSFSGPVAIVFSMVFLAYLYKIRTVWRILP